MHAQFTLRISVLGLVLLTTDVAFSQDYPNKLVRIVAAAAGGGSDFVARQIAQGIAPPLGQPVIVENRGGLLSIEIASKAPPDGYTLFVAGGALLTLPLLQETFYDVVRDFTPISQIAREVSVIAVHPSVPVKTVKELIALAKARPGELNYCATGLASPPLLATELFKSMAGINIVHIPYKGSAAATTALISGEVQVYIYNAGFLAPYVKSGKVRALAVTSLEPSALAPGLPTAAATGLPGYESVSMTGIYAPAKTPVPIVNRLNQEIVRLLNRAEVKERFLSTGLEIVASSPEQFAAAVKAEIARNSKVIKDAGIKAE